MSGDRLKLGLFGFGCVGQGLYETLQASGFDRAEVVKICIKNPEKPRRAPVELFTTEASAILNDPTINAVVELIDDAYVAYQVVTAAMRNGKHVVTANKKLVAEHLEELIALQEETGSALLYEAACCASIPVIRNLEEYYDNDLVQRVEGVLNGSTNYILTQLAAGEHTYQQALEQAQALGFAESDPSLDVGGFDSRYKLTLLLAHAFGLVVNPAHIPHLGIDKLNPQALQRAAKNGEQIRLVGTLYKAGQTIHAAVLPTLVPAHNELAQVLHEFNGVVVEGAFSERQFFRGKGAGSWPTGAAVLSDISALTYKYRYAYKKRKTAVGLHLAADASIWVRLSGSAEDILPLHAFEEVSATYHGKEERYVEGRMGLRNLVALQQQGSWCALALPQTHEQQSRAAASA